jgi:hypothetical protein
MLYANICRGGRTLALYGGPVPDLKSPLSCAIPGYRTSGSSLPGASMVCVIVLPFE